MESESNIAGRLFFKDRAVRPGISLAEVWSAQKKGILEWVLEEKKLPASTSVKKKKGRLRFPKIEPGVIYYNNKPTWYGTTTGQLKTAEQLGIVDRYIKRELFIERYAKKLMTVIDRLCIMLNI